jgi:hypothetical protein
MNMDVNTVIVEDCLPDVPAAAVGTLLNRLILVDWPVAEYKVRGPAVKKNTTVGSEDLDSAYPWVREGLQRIAKLGSLDDGWHECGAAPPNEDATALATRTLRHLAAVGFRPTSIDASCDEGVCITFSTPSRRANIECFNTGEVYAATVTRGGDPFIWEINAATLPHGIARIYSFIRE